METKVCRQCGTIKPIEQFRQYYGGRQGTYTICRSCEAINSRAKYLRRKGEKQSEADKAELAKIEELYYLQRACGLKPPASRVIASRADELDVLISKYESTTPAELAMWLTKELTEAPDVYDAIYDELLKRYRPVLYVDQATFKPVYDERHKVTLDKILERFTEYEDNYYN